jgi:general secretion pathway protein J
VAQRKAAVAQRKAAVAQRKAAVAQRKTTVIVMRRNKQQGFTLIEVLIAMAITVVVASIAYAGLDSAMRMSQTSQEQADNLQRLNRAFDVMAKDFRHVLPRMVRNPGGDAAFESAFIYAESAYPMLQLTRTGWYNPQPARFQRSNIQRVAYQLEDKELLRFSWQMPDHYSGDEADKVALLDKVTRFEVRLLKMEVDISPGGTAANNLQSKGEWVLAWPSNAYSGPGVASVPAAIEITIEHEMWGEIKRVFEIVDNSTL